MLTSPPGSLLGAPRPRVETHPPYVRTYGPEALELLRLAGQEPDPWQGDSTALMLGERADGKWACFEYCEWVPRQNGKGGILEPRVLAGLWLLGERLIMWSAHEYKTAMEAYLRVRGLVENLIDGGHIPASSVKFNNTNGEEGIELPKTRQRLKFIARSKSSGRGFSGDVNIIDEAFAYTFVQQAALMPTMSARPNPQIIYTSSPPLASDSGEVMFALRHRGDPTAPRRGGEAPWTQDDSLGYRDWGLPGSLDNLDELDLDDRDSWAAANPALGRRITVETVQRERRSMSGVDFARERLGVWPAAPQEAGGVISAEQWQEMSDPRSQAGPDIALAVDTTPDRAWSSIGLASLRPDGHVHLELIDHRRGTAWLVERLVQLKARHKPVAIALDVKGPAGSLLTDLEKAGIKRSDDEEQPERGDLIVPTASEVAAACGQLLDAARDGTDRHIDQAQLNVAVAGAKTRPLGDAVAWGRRQADVDISPLVAVTLARWALMERAHLIDQGGEEPWFFFG